MTKVIGVRFREVGKIYYFAPGDMNFNVGEKVIVETVRGIECGTVVLSNREVDSEKVVQPLKEVKRMATQEDVKQVEENRIKEVEAFNICKSKVIEHGLDMKLISAEYTFDNTKILFYFTAEGRVDFRDLVKDLAAIFKVRIELRQVGVRDETKIVGGIGSCGRPLCCHSYLSDFVPVSIKMAKEQNLSLNPQKISGVCGRLMCCLKNEAETYEYLNSKLPKEGETVQTKDGYTAIVSSINVLRQKVKVLITKDEDEKQLVEYPVEDLIFTPRKKKNNKSKKNNKEDELLDLEDEIEDIEILEIVKEDIQDKEAEDKKQSKHSLKRRRFHKKKKVENSDTPKEE